MRIFPYLVFIAALLFSCSEDTTPATSINAAEPATTTSLAPTGRVYRSTLENVPDWVPLPDEYTVIMDQGTGMGSIVIEVPGDFRAVVDRMNEQMMAQGYEPIVEKGSGTKANYMAQGIISDNSKGMAVINVGEYDGPGSSYKPGNTASISYMITRHDLRN